MRILHFDGTFDNSLIRIDSGFQATFKGIREIFFPVPLADRRSLATQC